MKLIFVFVLGLLCCVNSYSPSFAEEEPTCKEVLANETFRDALAGDDGGNWGMLVNNRDLLGLKCDVADLDAFFIKAGWKMKGFQMRSENARKGPFGPAHLRFYMDSSTGYTYCRPFSWTSILKKKCPFSVGITFFEGRISHITGGYNK